MLGEAVIAADVVLTGIAAFDYATSGSLIASLKFWVEEEEMLIDLKTLLTMSHSVVDGIADVTMFMDGTDMAAGANGLVRHSCPTVADQEHVLTLERTVRLAKGEHQLQLHMKAPAGNITVEGAGWNGWLTARRHSHPATLAQGVNAKSDDIY
jgi:hypothetical protein